MTFADPSQATHVAAKPAAVAPARVRDLRLDFFAASRCLSS
jgi:hypothetical protein